MRQSPRRAQTLPGQELGLIIPLPGQQRRALPQRTRRARVRAERGAVAGETAGDGERALAGPFAPAVWGLERRSERAVQQGREQKHLSWWQTSDLPPTLMPTS